MQRQEEINYNLMQISEVDKKINKLKKEKKVYMDINEKKYNMYDLFSKMQGKLFLTIIIVALAFITYSELEDVLQSILLTGGIVLVFNIIITILTKIYKPDENYNLIIEEFENNINELLIKRNTYINLYNYALFGEKALYDNIKSKIYNGKSYEYKSIDKLNYSTDSYEYITINEMRYKENNLIESIKNKVSIALKLPNNDEKLSKEQLLEIQNAL